MYAVQEKNLPIVITLLNAGADVTLKDVKGGSAIEICLLSAGRTSNAKIVKALLEGNCQFWSLYRFERFFVNLIRPFHTLS